MAPRSPPRRCLWKRAGPDPAVPSTPNSATPAACISGTRVNYGCICARSTEPPPTLKCTTTFWGGRSRAPPQIPLTSWKPGELRSRPASLLALGTRRRVVCKAPLVSETATTLNSHWREGGRRGSREWQVVARSACFAGQNLFPTIEIVLETSKLGAEAGDRLRPGFLEEQSSSPQPRLRLVCL